MLPCSDRGRVAENPNYLKEEFFQKNIPLTRAKQQHIGKFHYKFPLTILKLHNFVVAVLPRTSVSATMARGYVMFLIVFWIKYTVLHCNAMNYIVLGSLWDNLTQGSQTETQTVTDNPNKAAMHCWYAKHLPRHLAHNQLELTVLL